MANENPNHAIEPTRPFRRSVSTSSIVTPSALDGPGKLLNSNTSTPLTRTSSQSAPLVRQHDPCHRSVPLHRTQTMPPPTLSGAPPTVSTVQPLIPSMLKVPQPWSSSVEQTVLHPLVRPPTALFTTSMFPQELQGTSRQMQYQPQSVDALPANTDALWSSFDSSTASWLMDIKSSSPPVESAYSVSAPLQPSLSPFTGVQENALKRSGPASLPATSFAYQAGYASPRSKASAPFLSEQINYVPPPPIPAPPTAYSRNQMQQTDSVPPIGAAVDGMIEDLNSLSIQCVPGSNYPQLDVKALPRPLEGDVEPNSFAEIYPMNCKFRYLQLTTYAMPKSHTLVSRWHLPLGAVICPLAEAPNGEEVPVINLDNTEIIRCEMCRAIVNPYITFTDGGRTWQCNICGYLNNVPENYIASLDSNGKRMDLAERPELMNGSVEYVAAQGNMLQPSKPPVYFFLIDVSKTSIKSGMLGVIADTVRSCLDKLANFPGTQIGFITFDSKIHFYNMTSSLMLPQMLVVSDIDDIFVPLPYGLLVNLSESRALVDAFLDCLPLIFQHTLDVESAFGPAVKAANMVMSKVGGKLLIFQNTLPSLGVGRLWLRHDFHHFRGTDKEHVLRLPGDPFYTKMAAELTKHQITVDVYVFSDNYADIASLGTLSSSTGGQVYYYPNFTSTCHKEKLRYDLGRDLTRETAWEALMRVRCGRGLRIASIHGNLMFGATDLLSIPALDCDKAYTALLCLEETLKTSLVYFQVSLEYTSSSGERRMRVHTAALPVVTDLIQMYRHADTGAIISLYSRQAIEKTLSHKLEDARIVIQQQIVKALREYQSLIPLQNRQAGRMFYPESLKYMPLYGLSLCKSIPLRWELGDADLDERCAQANAVMALPVKRLLKLLFPSLFRIDDYILNASPVVDEFKKACKRLPLSAESLDSRGLYLYDDGCRFVIFFGRMLLPEIATNLLGKGSATDLPEVSLCEQNNSMARKLLSILEKLREENPSCYQLPYFIREGEQPGAHSFFVACLIEGPADGLPGYADWILKLFQHIQ